jgi:hypothetical protein
MAPQDVQAIESWMAGRVHEAEDAVAAAIAAQPLAVVTQAFWEVLLVKGHRCARARAAATALLCSPRHRCYLAP